MNKTKTLIVLAALITLATTALFMLPKTAATTLPKIAANTLAMTASAEQQTVKLKVNGMTCFSCPYQVESALKRVDGVITASASLDTREAEVTFDSAVTNIAALTEATTNAGFPSTLKP